MEVDATDVDVNDPMDVFIYNTIYNERIDVGTKRKDNEHDDEFGTSYEQREIARICAYRLASVETPEDRDFQNCVVLMKILLALDCPEIIMAALKNLVNRRRMAKIDLTDSFTQDVLKCALGDALEVVISAPSVQITNDGKVIVFEFDTSHRLEAFMNICMFILICKSETPPKEWYLVKAFLDVKQKSYAFAQLYERDIHHTKGYFYLPPCNEGFYKIINLLNIAHGVLDLEFKHIPLQHITCALSVDIKNQLQLAYLEESKTQSNFYEAFYTGTPSTDLMIAFSTLYSQYVKANLQDPLVMEGGMFYMEKYRDKIPASVLQANPN